MRHIQIMQQFTVPQFIDVEDKIIGPITTRQFVILLAAFILIAIFYKTVDQISFIIATVLIAVVAGTFAFVKINGRPFHFFMENIVQTFKRPNLRVWNKEDYIPPKTPQDEEEKTFEKNIDAIKAPYKRSRLNELSLIVDTKGAYHGEELGSKTEIEKNLENNMNYA